MLMRPALAAKALAVKAVEVEVEEGEAVDRATDEWSSDITGS